MISFPGARWWKFDFHTHTPASADYGKGPEQAKLRQITPEEWLLGYMRAGIDCVAVTDHNSGDWIDRLQAALKHLEETQPAGYRKLYLFPGVEVTANGGIHVLVLFDRSSAEDDVTRLLATVSYHGKPGESERAADDSVLHVIEKSAKAGAIPILAHVDGPSGAFRLAGNTLGPVLDRRELFAMEFCDPGERKPQLYLEQKRSWAEVLGSDAHHPAGSAQQRCPGSHFTWIKMGEPSLAGLKLALLDGAPLSVRRSDQSAREPQAVPELWIESIEVENARFMGRGRPLRVSLNPWLNAVVGGRGSGKSSLVEFIRLALRRESELPERLRRDFDEFVRVPESRDDRGALLAETTLHLFYRKDGARFRIGWRRDGQVESIEEEDLDGAWHKAPGDVRQRFPIRIFSQKQIFAMATEPQALLQVIDEAQSVDKAHWQQRWDEEETRILSLRANRRELLVRLQERPKVEGELADLRRKLAAFEEAEHAAILKRYQQRQRQRRVALEVHDSLKAIGPRLQDVAKELALPDPDQSLFDVGETVDAELLKLLHQASQGVSEWARAVEQLADDSSRFLGTWIASVRNSSWQRATESARVEYDRLVEYLHQQGVADPGQYGALVQQRQVLEQKLKSLDDLQGQIALLDRQEEESRTHLLQLRKELTERRQRFLAETLAGNPHVRMTVRPYGRSLLEAERAFREWLGREDGKFEGDILSRDQQRGLIAELYRELPGAPAEAAQIFEQRLRDAKKELLAVAAGETRNRFGAWLTKHLRQLRPETWDRLEFWFPEDGLDVSYRVVGGGKGGNDFRPIEQGSPGQKTAAILAFLLAHGEEPMVLDQPEDDLDNHLIYDLIVTQLRENKRRRQLVVVTHNPNIVVNGDAELVLAMDQRGGQCWVNPQGSLQSREIREEVCRVMEGGREAFERRYRRIALEGGDV